MKVGFWNINKNEKAVTFVGQFAKENEIDFLILFECETNPADILLELNSSSNSYYYYPSFSSDFVTIFTRFSASLLRDVMDDFRISAKEYLSPVGLNVNFIFLHYPSKLFFEEADQDAYSSEIRRFIEETEEKTKNDRTIILGDFNMNPFQKAMIQSTGLHSTFDKKIAMKGERVIKNKNYQFLYNPMWSFFGEKGKGSVNGTYYYSSATPTCYFWNIFDQVLLRPSLLDSVFDEDSLNIVNSIKDTSLLNNIGSIDKKISDHLPIEFELNNI